ncbi:MAG: CoA transferase [Chloroflexota bacterium]|mgnify:CR=1 FL=1
MPEQAHGPLAGFRVVDLSQMLAAPGAAMMLADQGAEVIKVEPLWGDQIRHTFTSAPMANSESRSFLAQNRNKRGIALDIREPRGREIVHRLSDGADVLIHNFRQGVAERLGLGFEQLHARNSRLVYAWLTGYGTQGPFARQAGYDYLLQALSGILSRRRLPDGTPMRAGVFVADMSAAMLLAYGVSLALLERARTGEGKLVTTSLLHAALAMQNADLVRLEHEPPQAGFVSPQALNSAYRCEDGGYLVIGIFQDAQWDRLCGALEMPDLGRDSRYETALARSKHGVELFDTLSALFGTRPLGRWSELLNAADVPCAPVLEWPQVFDHPQMAANRLFVESQHPVAGRTHLVAPAIRVGDAPQPAEAAPLLGQHTAAVLTELGYTAAEVSELVNAGIVGLSHE